MRKSIPWLKLAAAVALSAMLAGCVPSPRYQIVKRYVPPQGATAQVCLDKCAARMEHCKRDCEARYRSCAQAVHPEAEALYSDLLRQYEAALAEYRWELDRYRMDLMLGWGYGPYWGHGPYWGVWGWYPVFPPSPPPAAPSPEQVTARVVSERCDRDCGCQSGYESCFLGCGGTIEQHTECIANCPPPKP